MNDEIEEEEEALFWSEFPLSVPLYSVAFENSAAKL